MKTRLPPLSTLRAFEAVARLGSVTLAAAELGRTHGAVSKQLRTLQADVEAPLLEKAGKGLRLTPAGRQLAAAVAETLGALGETYSEIVRQARSPELNVACSSTFAMAWLVPHLPHFSQAHPDVRIRLTMMTAREIREERDADLVIMRDRSAYPFAADRKVIPLAPARFAVLAAPNYPFAWRDARTLSVACRIDHDHSTQSWDDWRGVSDIEVAAPGVLSFPHTHLCLSAAAGGMGVAMVEERLAFAELQSGRVAPLTEFIPVANGFVAVPHASKPLSPVCSDFLEWLRVEMRKPVMPAAAG